MATDCFLQLYPVGASKPLSGESRDHTFTGAIELTEFSIDTEDKLTGMARDLDKFKSSNVLPGLGAFTFTPAMWEKVQKNKKDLFKGFKFSISKSVDLASPLLFSAYCAAAAAGEEKQASFAKAVISVRKPGAADFVYLNCTFAGVYVVEYQLALKNTKTGLPDETVKFVSECYSVRYIKQFASGKPAAQGKSVPFLGWDFVKDVPYEPPS